MRKFIYLDTDTLNSYLAQIFDGLVENEEVEKTKGKKEENKNRVLGSLSGRIAFKLFGKGADAQAQATYEHLKSIANDEMVKDVQTKIMHDNAFNQFASYLEDNDLIGENEIGKFISIEDEFFIFDIDFYKNLFKENGFASILQNIQEDTIRNEFQKAFDELNRTQRRDPSLKQQQEKSVSDAIAKNEDELEALEKLINMLGEIIPYHQMLCISNYAVVLNEKYLRDDLKTASFKYGGKIKVVGYITNKVNAQAKVNISAFAAVGASINELIKIFFENVEDTYIVHPVAIYYDN